MYITKTFKYEKDGIIYVGGKIPENAKILESFSILNAESGKNLIRIQDNKNVGESILLVKTDSRENYREE